MVRPEGAEDISSALRKLAQRPVADFCRPFRAGAGWTVSQGLKPLAESLRPFGTKTKANFGQNPV